MATYSNLEINHYYLVRENADGEIILVQPIMETDNCFLLLHLDEIEITVWKKKESNIAEIIEELTEMQVAEYENLFEDEEDNWGFDDEELDEEEELGEEEEFEEEEEE
jgi:hypothetical protein